MTDVVYAVKDITLHDYIELKYSLRSLQKYLSGINKVYIVSKCLPEWIQNVEHIVANDYEVGHYKEFNICSKICGACQTEEVTDPFLFVNDDHFLLTSYDAATFPYYYEGEIYDKIRAWKETFHKSTLDSYRTSCQNTLDVLGAQNRPLKYFDVHCPILYDKKKFRSYTGVNWRKPYGYILKSLYSNKAKIEGVACVDMKLQPPFNVYDLEDRPWFSTCNRVLVPEFWEWMDREFPDKSRWEK